MSKPTVYGQTRVVLHGIRFSGGTTADVEVFVDAHHIAARMAYKALRTKTNKTKVCAGGVVVSLLNIVRAP